MKPLVIPCNREQEPERWKEIRRTGLGGSDIAAVCGLSPWRGPLAVYLEKVGQSPDRESTEAMEWGVILEDVIARETARRIGIKIRKANVVLRHPEHPFMLANLDRWAEENGERGVLECKNVGQWNAEEWADGQVPDYYRVQVLWYLAITGTQWGYIAPLIGGNRLRPVRIERDEKVIKSLINIGREFWRHVESKTPPSVDSSEASTRVLRFCYPQSEPNKVLTMGTDEQEAYARLLVARKTKKEAEEDERLAKNQLIAWLQDAEAATIPGMSEPAVTYKGVASKRLDSKSLALAHPDIAAPYYVESTSRRFVVGREEE